MDSQWRITDAIVDKACVHAFSVLVQYYVTASSFSTAQVALFLQSDVASDIESALSGPLETLSLRVEEVKDDGGADAKQLAEQQRKLCAVDRMVLFLERNWHLLAQSISEVRNRFTHFFAHDDPLFFAVS